MPSDLDEMFAALSRDADEIPVAEAPVVRRRGTQRVRVQATAAVALAVGLVAVGVGGVAVARRPAPKPTVDTPGVSSTLPPVGRGGIFGGPARLALPPL